MSLWEYVIPGYGQAKLARDAFSKITGQDNATKDALQGGGTQGYASRGAQLDEVQQMLMGQANGTDPSLADMQMRRGLQQAMQQQQAMQASARPGQSGMATRMMMQNQANLGAFGSQMGGQLQLQERQNAINSLGNILLGGRSQDVQAAFGGAQIPSGADKLMAMGQGIAGAYMMSDERVKEDIEPGAEAVRQALDALHSVTYKYKDEKHGKGPQVGIIAQDLEKTPIGKQAVEDTPEGKRVNVGRLGGFMLAALSDLHEQVKDLKGR